MKLGKLLHKVAILVPLLKLLGVKDKTVAAKVGKGLVVVDRAVNEPPRKDAGVVVLFVLVLIVLALPVIAMVADALSYR